jgi:hypothetical protein
MSRGLKGRYNMVEGSIWGLKGVVMGMEMGKRFRAYLEVCRNEDRKDFEIQIEK